MATIVTRTGKGSALTFAEGDANFTNLNADKLENITGESIGDLSDVNIAGTPTVGSVNAIDQNRTPNTIELGNGDASGLVYNTRIRFTGNDVNGTGLAVDTDYYIAAGIGANNYEISTTLNGGPISLTDTGIYGDFNWTAPDFITGAIFAGQTLIWDGANNRFNAGSSTLTFLSNNVAGSGFEIDNIKLRGYKETINDLGSNDNPFINISSGNVQKVSIASNLNLTDWGTQAGESVTLLVTGSGNVNGTGNYRFAGGQKALVSNSVVSIIYDGSIYWTSISTDFQA